MSEPTDSVKSDQSCTKEGQKYWLNNVDANSFSHTAEFKNSATSLLEPEQKCLSAPKLVAFIITAH